MKTELVYIPARRRAAHRASPSERSDGPHRRAVDPTVRLGVSRREAIEVSSAFSTLRA